MGPDAMILVFWMLSFKPTFSLSSFTFIERLFSSSFLSAIRVVSSAYLRLLIFLPTILISAYASSSSASLMMYLAHKLNKGDNIQPWCTSFPIWNKSVVPCPVLNVASWPVLCISDAKANVSWGHDQEPGIPSESLWNESVHPAREEKPSSRVAVFQNSPSADGIWVVAKVKMSRDCRKTEVENKK